MGIDLMNRNGEVFHCSVLSDIHVRITMYTREDWKSNGYLLDLRYYTSIYRTTMPDHIQFYSDFVFTRRSLYVIALDDYPKVQYCMRC